MAGPTLALAVSRIAFRGKVVACGGISGYEAAEDQVALPLSSYLTLLYQNASVLGIIVTAYSAEFAAVSRALVELVMEGKLVPYNTEVERQLEDVPEALNLLFTGGNVGKLVVKLMS